MSDAAGKMIARVGDKVSCPKRGCPNTGVIVSGDPTLIVDGQPVARHGDTTSCGATLIASQVVTYVDSGSSGGGGLGAGSAAAGSAVAAAVEPIRFEWDERVKLSVGGDAAVLTGLPWFVQTADGRTFSGRLGEDGQLPRIDTPGEESYDVFWGDEALAKSGGAS